jgi:hypothetical protein
MRAYRPTSERQKHTAEARRRGEQPSEAGVELGIPGDELRKPFRILVEVQGGGVGRLPQSPRLSNIAAIEGETPSPARVPVPHEPR